ncbi:uncharacterized protein FTJAE_8060 [Fusarium tjaetaba]|uniref:Uncharacterized protein n=1 Tax=Fusarium tjaetaba TaxID=1567544 RepID=A0A8H5VQL9_9HYPO|nr:uncharacterized protein FTJAE_8060 [Fusarium tjaetaba]KAF5630980.1 hypothetical protein FTJAE_8060 [Fusarium tjaetaba]
MASSANSDPPLFVPGTPSRISHYAMTYARRHPGDFLPYLRRVWPEHAERLAENPRCLRSLRSIKVLLENGETCRIYKTWVPLPELRRLRARYLLPDEKASFVHLDPPLPEDGTLGVWEFLPQLRCKTKPDVYFWTDTLLDIKLNSTNEVKSPRRVTELYILLYKFYLKAEVGRDGENKVAKWIRETFARNSLLLQQQGWINPDHAVCYGPEGATSSKPSMPLPARWNATPSETDLIERFYKRVLHLEDVNSYSGILEELRSYRNKYIWNMCPRQDVIKLYQALEDLDVRGREKERMIEEFKNEAFITYIPPDRNWEPSTWNTLNYMVWSHGVKLPRKVDISQQYPALKSFFVGRLKIPELTMEAVQQQIFDVAADAPADETFTLLSHLNIMIQNFAELIDPSELISKPIFPVLTPSGELKRVCCATDFFIVDDMRLFKLLRDNDNMLAFTRSQVMRLESLIKWLDVLVALVPADKKQRQLAMAVALPRLLMEWLMTGPETYGRGSVEIPELGVSLVKSVLSAPPELANDILEAEGIEQPFTLRGNRLPGIMQEECLDQMEDQEAEAPLQTTPEDKIPLADSPASQTPKVRQAGTLDAFLGIVPAAGSASERQTLTPRGQKRRPNDRASASSGSPPPLTGRKRPRKE